MSPFERHGGRVQRGELLKLVCRLRIAERVVTAIRMQCGNTATIGLLELGHVATWLKGEHPVKFHKVRFTCHVFPLCMHNDSVSDAR